MRAPPVIVALPLLAALAACGDGGWAVDAPSGPARDLKLETPAPELVEGETLQLRATSGGVALNTAAVRWESRDSSTIAVRAGIARGMAPGVTYVIARRDAAVDSVRLAVRFKLDSSGAGVRIGSESQSLRLQGTGLLVEYQIQLPFDSTTHGFATSVIAANGGVTNTPNGSCCMTVGDTVLQINHRGIPALGPRGMQPPTVQITSDIFFYGDDNVLLMVRESASRMRMYVPVRPEVLEVTAYTPPTPGRVGEIRGRMTFEAAGFIREQSGPPPATITPLGGRTTMVYVEFNAPMRYDYRVIALPPSGAAGRVARNVSSASGLRLPD